MNPSWKKILIRIAALLFAGAVIIPVMAYLVGGTIVGSYEGNGGLAGYLGTIYLSTWHGERAALMLILAPLLIVVIWLTALRIFRHSHSGQ